MEVLIRNDCVVIDGYVNAIERLSKPLYSRNGRFVEKVCVGAFDRALQRNQDVKLLLNHNWNRQLGTTLDNVELTEDNIGLKINATIEDPEVIEQARNGELVGFSFGFKDIEVENTVDNESGLPQRNVKDLELYEVSILNTEKTPAYNGTLVEVRSNGEQFNISDSNEEQIEIRVEEQPEENIESGETVNTTEEEPTNKKVSSVYYARYKNIITGLKIKSVQ